MTTGTDGTENLKTPDTKKVHYVRRHWVIDRKLQSRLILTSAAFSLACIIFCYAAAIWSANDFRALITDATPNQQLLFEEFAASQRKFQQVVMFGYCLFTGLFAYLNLRQSNRVAGPIYSLKRKMKLARETGEFVPVRFREGDYFQELGEEYNSLVEHLNRTKK